tara:strand:+ start:1790 stop:2233 length:444 start_codon:yes stop_codon:yes gene_type:complete
MKALFLIGLAALSMQAQQFSEYMYESSTTAVTVQRPTTGNRTLSFRKAWMYCAAEQTATLKWNGTAATTTAGTAIRLPGTTLPAQASVYTASNVGSGTTGGTYVIPAGLTYAIDLSVFKLGSTGSATNLTISTNGTCTITVTWGEDQ